MAAKWWNSGTQQNGGTVDDSNMVEQWVTAIWWNSGSQQTGGTVDDSKMMEQLMTRN